MVLDRAQYNRELYPGRVIDSWSAKKPESLSGMSRWSESRCRPVVVRMDSGIKPGRDSHSGPHLYVLRAYGSEVDTIRTSQCPASSKTGAATPADRTPSAALSHHPSSAAVAIP